MASIVTTINGTPEQSQKDVVVEFEGYPVKKFFGNEYTLFINHCKIVTPLNFHPQFVKDDLEIAIGEAIGLDPQRIRFECDVEFTIAFILVESKITEPLFI